jgi:hypothetical protein
MVFSNDVVECLRMVGDRKTFEEKLDAFQTQGYISLLQRDAMRETLEIGHAAMHRSFKPNEKELTVALDIVEGIFAPIFDHTDAAANLSDRVPPRSSTPKPKPRRLSTNARKAENAEAGSGRARGPHIDVQGQQRAERTSERECNAH